MKTWNFIFAKPEVEYIFNIISVENYLENGERYDVELTEGRTGIYHVASIAHKIIP